MLDLSKPLAEFDGQTIPLQLCLGEGKKLEFGAWKGELTDAHGSVVCFIKKLGEEFEEISKRTDPVAVDADWKVSMYKDVPQLDCVSIRGLIPITEENLGQFLQCSKLTTTEWWAFYDEHVEPLVDDENIRKLIRSLLSQSKKFFEAPAAKGMHHSFHGGLAEHVHTLLRLFVSMRTSAFPHPQIESCDASLVIFGLIMHDFGKVWDYKSTGPNAYEMTRQGMLTPHLPYMPVFLATFIQNKRMQIPKETFSHMIHVLLAHHGTLEFGSPTEPKTIEAQIVHSLDMLDTRLFQMWNTPDEGYRRGLGSVVHYQKPTSS